MILLDDGVGGLLVIEIRSDRYDFDASVAASMAVVQSFGFPAGPLTGRPVSRPRTPGKG